MCLTQDRYEYINKMKKKQHSHNNINWETLFADLSREHTKLIKWLYDNHKDVLREYEKHTLLRVEFLE